MGAERATTAEQFGWSGFREVSNFPGISVCAPLEFGKVAHS